MAKTLDEAGVKRLIQEIKGANKNLNTPIPILTENTTESMAQNLKNIADYVEKAKAAGVTNVNGVTVTCLIDNDYSGVGYLYVYSANEFIIQGVLIKDDLVDNMCFNIFYNGSYSERGLIVSGNGIAEVNSYMLATGARRPIILTDDTTEVDQETYLKLIDDGVDVVFKDGFEDAIYELVERDLVGDDTFALTFISFFMGDTSTYFSVRRVNIEWGEAPHKVTITTRYKGQLDKFLEDTLGFLPKNKLTPVLQEIDLRGTDADRKAKLDKFETDWKDLTGVGDLAGARFIGHYLNNDALMITGVFSYDGAAANYSALTPDENDKPYVISLELDGSLTITPLFSHLEAIIIQTGSTDAIKQANKTAIDGYINNLESLGVDVNKGFIVPVNWAGYSNSGILSFIDKNSDGVGFAKGTYIRSIKLFTDGSTSDSIIFDMSSTYQPLKTTSKKIIGAINEVNALAKGVKAFGAIELKASDNATNKATLTAYLKILTDAGVSITNGYSVPVRITGNSQEYHGMLNIGTGVLLSGVVTDVNENHHYPFNVSTTDGAILFDENNYFLEKGSNEVIEMLDAIKYSYTAVPFTDTTLSNKAQLEVFLSKVPNATVMHCTYKEIWAGTLHKINGDWYGLLVKNTNSPADNINVKLSADGTIVTSNSAQ